MDRGDVLLAGLMRTIRAWTDHIRRSTGATEVLFKQRARGEFSVTVQWKNKDSSSGEYSKEFTRAYVFGGTLSLSPNAWAIERKGCDHARDVIRAVLQQRGVL